jgi:predicted kinase
LEAILFIGIPASGKSTFYKEHFFSTHVRINLDMLKTRNRELMILQACLSAKQPFVVDNTNVRKSDRAPYIQLAKAVKFRVAGYYFEAHLETALERNRQRSGKASIPEKGLVAKFGQLEVPNLGEGFDQLFYVTIDSNSSEFLIKEWDNSKYA